MTRLQSIGQSAGEKLMESMRRKQQKIYRLHNECLYYIGETLWPLWYGTSSESIEVSDLDPSHCMFL
jgi:hypothetical protein